MTATLMMSALSALTLSSIIAFFAVDTRPANELTPSDLRISAAEREQAHAAMRERVGL